MISKEKIREAKEKLGSGLFTYIVNDRNLTDYDESKFLMKSLINTEESTPSCTYYKDGCVMKDFSSGRSWDFIEYCMEFKYMSFQQAVQELFSIVGMEIKEKEKKMSNNDDFFLDYKYPKYYDDDKTNVEKYLSIRGISKEVLKYADVTARKSEYKSLNDIICFNYYDENNTLVLVKERTAGKVQKGMPKCWCQKDADTAPCLFNMNKIDYTKPIVICEGEIDALSVLESGYTNVVSVPLGAQNLQWIEFNYEFLDLFDEIILWFDNDAPGIKAVNEAINRLGDYRCKVVKPDTTIQAMVEKYYKQFNEQLCITKTDANNILLACGVDYILQLIATAQEIPDDTLKDITSYEEIDIQTMPKNSTGFNKIDKSIYGIFKNSLNIITAVGGAGKSTLINMMGILAPIEQGEKVMLFSGEMSSGIILGQLFGLMAGRNHTIEWDNGPNMPKGYTVTKDAKLWIKKWLKGRLYLYDTSSMNITTDAYKILDKMIYAYKRYGITNFVIDNLMCLSFDTNAENMNLTQTEFIVKLKTFTNVYPVSVFLVAHAKKIDGGAIRDANVIAGSSNIPNAANRVFYMEILKDDQEGYNNKVTVLKDRETGMLGKEFKMYYDFATRRIYSNETELSKSYKWEIEYGKNIHYDEHISKMLVCNKKSEAEEIF